MDKILITGGAGFVGSATVKLLVNNGYETIILDNFDKQVHSISKGGTINSLKEVTVIRKDVRNRKVIANLIKDVDGIIHLAAAVGVGQSSYEIEHYVDVNTRGTSLLLDVLINSEHSVKKMVIASSMSVYGEGQYYCNNCSEPKFPLARSKSQLIKKKWDYLCQSCDEVLLPMPTNEKKPLNPTSIYAMTKRHQEEMCLLTGSTFGFPVTALRYFNIYGTGQSLSNPYTGVASIFLNQLINQKNPYIFEDGLQKRDFIHVSDVARANLLALDKRKGNYEVINIGTGDPISILEIANLLISYCEKQISPKISKKYRIGDIRNCFADVYRAQEVLGFSAKIKLKDGFKELYNWAMNNKEYALDLFDKSLTELNKKKLVV